MSDESCRTCIHWRRSGEKRKKATTGFCNQWSPYDYLPRRGARSPLFLQGISPGIFTPADEWCAKYKEAR